MMFGARWEILRLYGIPVRIDASWLLLAFLITWTLGAGVFPAEFPDLPRTTYWIMGAAAAVGLLFSILLHELSHALVARRFGIPMGGITLFIFGGVAEMEDEPPTAKSELLMAAAGPIASFAIAGALYLLLAVGGETWPAPVRGVLSYLALINLILAAFNLLPAFPLDGGRVFRAALWMRRQDFASATRLASRVGLWGGTGLMALGVMFLLFYGSVVGGIWWIVIGLFLRGAAKAEAYRLEISQLMEGHPVADFMTRDPITVPSGTRLDQLMNEFIYRHHFSSYPVLDGARAIGLVGLKQLKSTHEDEWATTPVDDVMIPIRTEMIVRSDMPAMEALRRLQKDQESRLLVVEDGHFLGMVSLVDLISVVGLMVELRGTD